MSARIILFALCLLNASCASDPAKTRLVSKSTLKNHLAENPAPERAFPQDSFYELLTAEFALRRNIYPLALSSYLKQAPKLRDPRISAHTTKIAIFLNNNKAAIDSANLWIELDPNNPKANLTLGELLIKSNNPINSIQYFESAAKSGMKVNFSMLAERYNQLSDDEKYELRDELTSLKSRLPKNISLIFTLAIIRNIENQPNEAIQLLNDILEIDTDHRGALLLKASLQLNEGISNPLLGLKHALNKNPADSKLRLEYAKLLTRHDLNQSRKQFEMLSAESPEDPELILSLALINREAGDKLAAKAYLKKLIPYKQKAGEARLLLGRIAENESDYREALNQYMLISGGPEFLVASTRIGQIFLRTERLSNFSNFYNRSRKTHPHYGENLFSIEADLLAKASLNRESLAVFSRGISLYPNSLPLRYNRSIIAEKLNDLALAEKDLRSILSSNPSNSTALNALGYTLANKTNRLEEAHELIAKALKIQPNEPAILDSMGWVLYRQKNFKRALEFLKRAYKLLPDPEVAAHIGEVLWITGEIDEAKKIWDEAIEKSPNHEILKATIERFKTDNI